MNMRNELLANVIFLMLLLACIAGAAFGLGNYLKSWQECERLQGEVREMQLQIKGLRGELSSERAKRHRMRFTVDDIDERLKRVETHLGPLPMPLSTYVTVTNSGQYLEIVTVTNDHLETTWTNVCFTSDSEKAGKVFAVTNALSYIVCERECPFENPAPAGSPSEILEEYDYNYGRGYSSRKAALDKYVDRYMANCGDDYYLARTNLLNMVGEDMKRGSLSPDEAALVFSRAWTMLHDKYLKEER